MQKMVLKQMLVTCGVLLLFLFLFISLQDEAIYRSTLGRFVQTYEKTGTQRNSKIKEVTKPYTRFTEESINHWDAALYIKIRNDGYSSGTRYSKEKLAFYPLFPFLWRLSGIDSLKIVYFNYAIFILGLILLSSQLMEANPRNLVFYAVGIILPSAATYYLPYAESLFVLTLAIAIYGIFKKQYWVFASGAFLFAMTRPSSLIFIFSLLAADLVMLLGNRNFKYFVREAALKIAPFFAGFLLVTLVQYSYTGSMTSYFESLELWPAESGFFNAITDWSVEGFGMSVFSIFFIALPALIYLCFWMLKEFKRKDRSESVPFFKTGDEAKRDYLFHVSLIFIAANLVYTLLTSGNVINGFYRYTMSVPFFYIVLFLLPEKISQVSLLTKMIFCCSCLAAMSIFLSLVVYGGSRFTFRHAGLFLSVLLTFFLLFEDYLPRRIKWITLGLIAIPCLIWHTYLFNMYLTDAWIYT
jgi:hypothetical protein